MLLTRDVNLIIIKAFPVKSNIQMEDDEDEKKDAQRIE